MPTDHSTALREIRTFPSLVCYLRDKMGWPIETDDFEELTFDYSPEELGIDAKNAAKIEGIKQLRPLVASQPWGIFFVEFEPRRLPVVALRRILSRVALRKRASANPADRKAWAADDLLFVSNYGEGENRQITFAHFSKARVSGDRPTLKVLGWNNLNTPLHLDHVAKELTHHLSWPENDNDAEAWRQNWRAAFTSGHRESITTSRDLSIRLAKLARGIRDLIKTTLPIETESGPLTKLMNAFREALIHDLDEAGFADMYAQTIAYGLLSARIANPSGKTAEELPAQMPVTNPFLKELMETFLHVGGRRGKADGPEIDFDELGVSEVVELLEHAKLDVVLRDFRDRNPEQDPITHFYELFLNEFDQEQKKRLGAFYTPWPVVSFIVRSVDDLLRTEFGLEDGLADTTTWREMVARFDGLTIPAGTSENQAFVQILDPATGTGTFLVEVINLIHGTMTKKWKNEGHDGKQVEALWNDYVPEHLLPRLHGYELQMAPYATAHISIGLKLLETGYQFGSSERARIYLTNALEPAHDFSGTFQFEIPALAHEAKAVNEIKRGLRFTVIIGNPPYSGLSANMGPWTDGLLKGKLPDGTPTASYYHVDGEPLGERKVWLQDDYVKFTRLSQWLLDETGCGVHGFITNHGYLDNPTFRGMRWSLMSSFDEIYAIDLHGNLKKRETPPEGGKDLNVFDIQQGVAIGLFVKKWSSTREGALSPVRHFDLWGSRGTKYDWLLRNSATRTEWTQVSAASPFFLFEPFDSSENADYRHWPAINDVMPVNVTGIVTARDGFVIDMDEERLLKRIKTFLNENLSDEQVADALGLKENYAWRVKDARHRLRDATQGSRLGGFVEPILYRPFDARLMFWHASVVWRLRAKAMPHMLAGENYGLVFMRQVAQGDSYSHFVVSRLPVDNRAFYSNKGIMSFAPLYLYPGVGKCDRSMFGTWLEGQGGRLPNLDAEYVNAIERSTSLAFHSDGRGNLSKAFGPEDVFAFIYAVFHSPEYRRRFEPMLKLDFPRVPTPGARELFTALARRGSDLIALHLLESSLLGKPCTPYAGPEAPGVGRVGWSGETVWLDAGRTDARKGHRATEPGTIGFQGVSEEVWDFHIGGYQVCHKWLKDRKGRTLSADDIVHYQKIVVAIRETIHIMAEIDEVIETHGGWPGAFQAAGTETPASATPAFEPRFVEPTRDERFVACVPLVPLKAAAGAFGDPQQIDDGDWEWVALDTKLPLRPGMFVAQVVGRSMEPAIPDGSYCLFSAPVTGTREGKIVLVQLRDSTDPESGERYTVKRYESEKAQDGDSWRHATITLRPNNAEFEPIVLTGGDDGQLQVVAELVDVLGSGA